jgi:sulfite exporter TauE/SafE
VTPGLPWPIFAAAATLGFAGSVHCLGMCGGIAAAAGARLGDSSGPAGVSRGVAFNAGRVLGYAALGAFIGALAGAAIGQFPLRPLVIALRGLAAVLMLAMGLALLSGRDLLSLERLGGRLWTRLRPLAGRALGLPGPLRFAALGLLWGFLPCGLVYSALALAAVAGSAAAGAGTMLAFGTGTLPSMLAVTLAGTAVTRRFAGTRTRSAAGILMIAFAIWTALGPMAPRAGHRPMQQQEAGHAHP